MALTKTQVSQLYVAIFNRASEGEGNTYWQTAVSGKAATASAMLETDAAKNYFGASLNSNQAFIEHIYKNTLGKTYADDKAGIDYWVKLLNEGKSRGEIVVALIEAAQAPENKGAAQDMFNNKVEVSDYTAMKIQKADANDLSPFTNLITGVTNDVKTVDASKQQAVKIANEAITGDTKFLAVTQDVINGTAGNDVFISYVAQNQNGQQVNTLGSGDVINGGTGIDTLDAQVTAGSWVGATNGNMGISPYTKGVENVVLHAEIADFGATNKDLVIVNAKNMEGVLKIASNYSDASLLVQNAIGPVKGVYGGTAKQTIAMEYTGNADSHWNESDMTVFYDQDYLVRSSVTTNSLYYFTQDRLATQETGKPFGVNTAVDGIKFRVNDSKEVIVKIAQDKLEAFLNKVPASGVEAYQQFANLLNESLQEQIKADATLAGFEITLDSTFYRTNGGKNNGGDPLDQNAYAIVLTAPDNVRIDRPAMNQNNKFIGTYDMYNDVSAEGSSSQTPVRINVDLEKVGLAADGGALTIGSMNKDGQNVFNHNQSITTTDTVAGFDEFNVHVNGDKTKNSSVSALQSTDNTLRKVTIDSKVGSVANLTIGNSNTAVAVPTDVTANYVSNQSANNAGALKDVQVLDASAFKGDLTLHAGFTEEIVAKYLANVTETTLYGLNSAKNELASFDYKGGEGNDTFNLALDLANFAEGNFHAIAGANTDKTNTNGLNVFEMNVNGGNGDDTIIVDADTVNSGVSTATNITINGANGNDLIDIQAFKGSWTYNVAFNNSFGHDTIKGFDIGAVEVTNESQTLDLAGFAAHKGDIVVVNVGDKTYEYKVTEDSLTSGAIATKVAAFLTKDNVASKGTVDQFTNATATAEKIAMNKTDANVNSVTVEVKEQVEADGTYDKDTKPVHTATSKTLVQGGLVEATAADFAKGGDTLDFSAYGVKGVIVDRAIDLHGTNADLTDGSIAATSQFIYLQKSYHDADVYDAYMATSTKAIAKGDNVDFTATTGNATKGGILGSINLDDAANNGTIWNELVASQLLF